MPLSQGKAASWRNLACRKSLVSDLQDVWQRAGKGYGLLFASCMVSRTCRYTRTWLHLRFRFLSLSISASTSSPS
jgi:hypothetical protein